MTLEALRFLLMNRQVPGSICQRKEDNNALYITTTSWMASCRTGDLYLCWGSPWQTGFGRYALTAPAP